MKNNIITIARFIQPNSVSSSDFLFEFLFPTLIVNLVQFRLLTVGKMMAFAAVGECSRPRHQRQPQG